MCGPRWYSLFKAVVEIANLCLLLHVLEERELMKVDHLGLESSSPVCSVMTVIGLAHAHVLNLTWNRHATAPRVSVRQLL